MEGEEGLSVINKKKNYRYYRFYKENTKGRVMRWTMIPRTRETILDGAPGEAALRK